MLPYTPQIAEEAAGIHSPIPQLLLSYNISGRLLLNLCIMSHRGNHLSVLYDKIPVFHALKYPKFKTIAFYESA